MIKADPEPPSNEAALLEIIAAELSTAGLSSDLSDDCAHLREETALVTTDTLVEGVHFDLNWDSPTLVGRQAAVVNLSDLAGSGGSPGWLVWSLALPRSWSAETVRCLTAGFAQVAVESGASIVGGNLTSTSGPAVISVTAGGALVGSRPLTRDRAQVGDIVYVSGNLGDRALGYLMPSKETRAVRHEWRPHLDEARQLATTDGVGACMDISDGFLRDAARLADTSRVRIEVISEQLPVSEHYRQRCGDNLSRAMTGGEDYVLLFTARPHVILPAWAIAIGHCTIGSGVFVDEISMPSLGYDHFQRGR